MEQFNVGDCVKSRLIPSMIGTIMDINKRFNTATLSIISNKYTPCYEMYVNLENWEKIKK